MTGCEFLEDIRNATMTTAALKLMHKNGIIHRDLKP